MKAQLTILEGFGVSSNFDENRRLWLTTPNHSNARTRVFRHRSKAIRYWDNLAHERYEDLNNIKCFDDRLQICGSEEKDEFASWIRNEIKGCPVIYQRRC